MQNTEQVESMNQVVGYEKPTAHVGFRLPPSVAEHWKQAAESKGKSLSDWLRAQIKDLEIRMAETKKKPRGKREVIKTYQRVDPVLINELARIGSNLNQLSKQANRAAIMGQTIQVISFLMVLTDMQGELRAALQFLRTKNVSESKENSNAH